MGEGTPILIAILGSTEIIGTTSNNDSLHSSPPPSPEPQDHSRSPRNFMQKSHLREVISMTGQITA